MAKNTTASTFERDTLIEAELERKLAHKREVLDKLKAIRAPKDVQKAAERSLEATRKEYEDTVARNEAAAYRLLSYIFGDGR